ncbi:MAG: hypothetical protein PHV70_11365 [Desulfobacteraceae bacterium]|nr:hypothetical protein [Desulfobacteraceae bacterium]
MKWNFWSKNQENAKTVKLPKPREMPQALGMYLVTRLNQNPDVIWKFKAALLPREGSKQLFAVRIFNPVAVSDRNVRVVDYNSLDEVPDLILFQGTYDEKRGKVELSRPGAGPSAA